MGSQISKFGIGRCDRHKISKSLLEDVKGQQLIYTRSHEKALGNDEAPGNGPTYATFDVFLNHRGVDTKEKFVGYLEEELVRAGLHPFLDAKSLVKGEHAFESIDQALEEAQVHVAVISKRYAESKWCLNELLAMFKSGKPIIPIFYEVEPRDLHLLLRPSTAAFKKHVRRGRDVEVKEWAKALQKLSEIIGFRSATFTGSEAKLKNEIVNEIQRVMPPNKLLRTEEYQVDLESTSHECIRELENMQAATGILNIIGIGGIGKTTLSRHVFNWYASQRSFQRMTFLNDIRSASLCPRGGYNKLAELQKQLLWDLLRVPKDDHKHDYWYWFQRLSRQGPMFIVLDNIDHESQFEQLIPDVKLLPLGSRIIVTSRMKRILNFNDKGLTHCEYKVKCLNSRNALKLFNWHAFGCESVHADYSRYVDDIVQACFGLPLALKVIGSTLCNKKSIKDQEDIWPEAVQALKEHKDILEVLKWSYDSLQSAEEKLMFLDIAWFQDGIDEKMALNMWEACRYCASCTGFRKPKFSLENLKDRCLVEEKDGKLVMHDMLREMAHDAMRNQSGNLVERSHHWEVPIVENILEKNHVQVANLIRGLTVAGSTKAFSAKSFASMERLHFLILDGCVVSGDFTLFPKDLRLLQWRQMPFMQLPLGLDLSRLTTLNLSFSKDMTHLWTDSNAPIEICRSLRTLNLSGCRLIKTLPETIGLCSDLRILTCELCSSLESLPEQISSLSKLEELNVNFCRELEALPDSIGQLKQLYKLNILICEKLNNLPDNIGNLSNLKSLDLGGYNLQSLPESFGQLSALEELSIAYGAIKQLPSSFGGLTNLKTMWCVGTRDLEELPHSFCDLVNMMYCLFVGCSLRFLPDDFGNLSNMRYLHLHQLENLVCVPTSFGFLSNLQCLRLTECNKLEELPQSFTNLHNLRTLNLGNNCALRSLPEDFGCLSSLSELDLSSCIKLEQLPASIVELQKLKILQLKGSGLKCLPEYFERLTNLIVLDLSNCPNLPDSFINIGFKYRFDNFDTNFD